MKKRRYNIKTSDGVVYGMTQPHLKPYMPKNKNSQAVQSVSQPMAQSDHMQPVKQLMTQSDHKKSSQAHTSRPERDTKPLVKLDL